MDLTLSDDQRLLADTARRLLRDRCTTDAVRDAEEKGPGYSAELWRTVSDLGWAGIIQSEDHGGLGQSLLDFAVLAEECGRAAFTSPLFVSTGLAALPITWSGSPSQQDRWLRSIATGEAVATLALYELDGRRDCIRPSVSAHRAGDHWVLDGDKVLVPYAASADLLLALVALEGEGTSLVIIDPISEALSVERERTFGGEPLYRVKFHSVVITSDDVVSTPGRGGEALERAIQHYTVLQLAYLTGLSEGALQICLSHVRERQQFGRSIGSFQAVAHRCVDMQTDIDAMRILTLQAAWELGRSGRNRPSVSVAKAYGNGAARRIFTNAHQVTAAMGFSMEFDLQLFTRRAKAIELNGGATTAHLERVAVAIGLDEDLDGRE